jgi:hemerythrin-like metal-binding protein
MAPLRNHLTGNDKIDAQHAEILARVARFREQTQDGKCTPEILREFLSAVHDYTVEHFRAEESLMADLHYPYLWQHRERHYIVWRDILGLIEACEACGFSDACGERVQSHVSAWILKHIEEEDIPFAEWMRAKTDGMLDDG